MTPPFLVCFRQVAHNVLPLVPLTPLNLSASAKDFVDRLAHSFAAVNDAEKTLLEREAPLDQVA
jgi:hypothetical protein